MGRDLGVDWGGSPSKFEVGDGPCLQAPNIQEIRHTKKVIWNFGWKNENFCLKKGHLEIWLKKYGSKMIFGPPKIQGQVSPHG